MLSADLPERLSARLLQPLPGRNAQSRFEPEGATGRHFQPAADARQAAVAVLLYPQAGDWFLPLTVRPDTLSDHPGQISLPGGAVEQDESTEQAALRELNEELGVQQAGLAKLGQLSPLYVFVSNFCVTSWVFAAPRRPPWTPNPDEVVEVLELPLSHLVNAANYAEHTRLIESSQRRVPHIGFGRHQIWGATSMILGELAVLLEEVAGP